VPAWWVQRPTAGRTSCRRSRRLHVRRLQYEHPPRRQVDTMHWQNGSALKAVRSRALARHGRAAT
jgi:hypothetical protein